MFVIGHCKVVPREKGPINIGLFFMTVQWRTADISDTLHDLQNKITLFQYYSFSIDESMDIKDTTHLAHNFCVGHS
jgi:hypothetical protein